MITASGTGTAARMAVLDRLETTAAVLAEMLTGGATKPVFAWTPRSLRELAPGEVRLTLTCGPVVVNEAAPCSPTALDDHGAKATQLRQLNVRAEILERAIVALARSVVDTIAPAEEDSTAPDPDVVADALRRTLRVARNPIGMKELAKRTGYDAVALREAIRSERARKMIQKAGERPSEQGRPEPLWEITEKGAQSA